MRHPTSRTGRHAAVPSPSERSFSKLRGMAAATVSIPAATAQIDYEDLYERWEKGNWRSTELDFSQDKKDWHEGLSDLERRAALWNYAMFFHGEDSVADNLSPYIDAAPKEEQKYFLATQQAAEARHAVFFARFMREVVGRGDDRSEERREGKEC